MSERIMRDIHLIKLNWPEAFSIVSQNSMNKILNHRRHIGRSSETESSPCEVRGVECEIPEILAVLKPPSPRQNADRETQNLFKPVPEEAVLANTDVRPSKRTLCDCSVSQSVSSHSPKRRCVQ
jgi:hypothetical protein